MKKVLLASIGGSSAGAKPLSTSLLSAILKSKGHEVVYFDTTFMDLGFPLDGEISDSVMQFKKVDWGKYNLLRDKSIIAKSVFLELIEKERPDLIAASCMSDMYPYTIDFLRNAKDHYALPVIIGGIHTTLLPDEVIAEDCIDALCIGEGEEAILEFVDAVSGGHIARTDIRNLWIKENGIVHRNPIKQLGDINELPFLDYSIYDPRQFLRPFEGRIIKSGDVQDIRGCPRRCPYCANAILNKLYPKKRVRFFSPERFVEEVK
ncbi:MAG: cobalamin-dependent protein, partial [Deltaproteobacteria bacterium]|nr:cobalamin-dependent protein [Deltaproteobacteria bacterium]